MTKQDSELHKSLEAGPKPTPQLTGVEFLELAALRRTDSSFAGGIPYPRYQPTGRHPASSGVPVKMLKPDAKFSVERLVELFARVSRALENAGDIDIDQQNDDGNKQQN